MIEQVCLSFDDVLIDPTYTTVRSRTKDTSTVLEVGGIPLRVPLISSPMDTVTESHMAIKLGLLGGMGIIHRFASVEKRIEMIQEVIEAAKESDIKIPVVFAIGVTENEMNALDSIMHIDNIRYHVDMVCIDIANGYSIGMAEMVSYVKEMFPSLKIMAGNIANADGYDFMAELGVDAVRVGIGGGSICKTRIQTGIGIPTLQSVLDCNAARERRGNGPDIIADGGIKYPMDLCKSLVAGAHAVICGGIFAGTKEAPGEVIMDNEGNAFKAYRGMASEEVQVEKRGGLKEGTVAEGVATTVPYKGSMKRVVLEFQGGLRSSMTYVNARTLDNYIGRTDRLRRITENGIKESHAYGTRKR